LYSIYVNDLQIKRVIEIEKQSGVLTNRIPVLRAEKGWTQKQLADLLGVTRQTVISIEKNKYKPSLLMGFRIAALFEKDINEVFQYQLEEDDR
jgi:putative transcriptional regulator